ncbi:hypothetical protein ACT7DN_28110 [Bacillus paranthracis]
MNLDFSAITPSIPYILKGLEVTLKIVAVSALAGFLLGTLLALCKIARIRALNIANRSLYINFPWYTTCIAINDYLFRCSANNWL